MKIWHLAANRALFQLSLNGGKVRNAAFAPYQSFPERIELNSVNEPYEIEIDGEIPVTISIERDGACFVQSDCRDKICVKTGKLTKPGQSAVCLPAGVSIVLEGESEIDAVQTTTSESEGFLPGIDR